MFSTRSREIRKILHVMLKTVISASVSQPYCNCLSEFILDRGTEKFDVNHKDLIPQGDVFTFISCFYHM